MPRMLTAQLLALGWPTCTPVASRMASGRFKTPARRMSSPVTTSMPFGADHHRSGWREAVVTSRFVSWSSDSVVRSAACGSWMQPTEAGNARPTARPNRHTPSILEICVPER